MEQTTEQTYEALINTPINLVVDKPVGKEEASLHIYYDRDLLEREQALRLLLMLAIQSSETFARNLEDVFCVSGRSELTNIVERYDRDRTREFMGEIADYLQKIMPLLTDNRGILSGTVLLDMTHLNDLGQYDTVVVASSTPDDPFTGILKAIRQNPALQERVRELLAQNSQDDDATYP